MPNLLYLQGCYHTLKELYLYKTYQHRYFFIPSHLKSNQASNIIIQSINSNDISKTCVTIKQVACDNQFYKAIEKEFEENETSANTLWDLLYGEKTLISSPRLWAIAMEGQLMGYVITFDFYQATYITCLQIYESHRGEGWGSMLLQHICKDTNRTYVLLSEVAMSDSEQLFVCVRRKMFFLKNGFRAAPVKWHSEYYYKFDVHVKGPNLELGSLLAVLRKGRDIWNTTYVSDIKPMII